MNEEEEVWQEEKVWRPYRRTVGYDSRGPLISRPAPYIHHAVCNKGELGRAIPRPAEAVKKRVEKPKKPKD